MELGNMFARSWLGMPMIWHKLGHIWSQNMPFLRYLKFVSSDFDVTFRKCYRYVEGRLGSLVTCLSILAQACP